MTGKLSPAAQQKLATLQQVSDKVQHVHGLVERYATMRDAQQAEQYGQPMKRAFGRLKIELMGLGLDSMSQLAGAMEIAAGRSGAKQTKARILREGVGSLRFQVEQEQKQVIRDDEAARPGPAEADQGDGA
jgi:hypothetical protein